MKTLIRLAAAALLCAPAAFGAVSPEEAARLGAELTPLGGEQAANTDGSIPAWTGGLKSAAEAGFPGYHAGDHYPDPYAGDKPLFSITAANSSQYAAKLTEVMLLGVVALRAGKKIEYDGENMRVTNSPKANDFLRREPRQGWTSQI